MPIQVLDHGANNTISLDPELVSKNSGVVLVTGNNNTINIRGPVRRVDRLDIEVGSNCNMSIEDNCILGSLFIYLLESSNCSIASWSSINGSMRVLMHEPSSIRIGKDCLFGGGVELSTSDMHSIIDVNTNRRINPAGDISIEDHVWVGSHCSILKGASIGYGSVIGTRSVVTSQIPPQSVAAGTPAKVLKSGVTWTHALLKSETSTP
jgi:acetyltransferase-like isoleucine patch superfamily enzyme